jgi:uncharacterized OB-fold protein
MASFGQVTVKNGSYKIKGDFHQMRENVPIRNADEGWRLMGVTNPRDITHIHMYGGEAPFFENIGKGKILGTRCDNPKCEFKGTTNLPFRIHCPDCLYKNTIVDLTDVCKKTARIHSFMVCKRSGAFNSLEKPIKFINIEFEGVDTILMSYLSVGDPKIGMRVVPIFQTLAPTYTIVDLSWVEEGVDAKDLPMGFTYA